MNRASIGLGLLAGLALVMLTFGGVCFLAGAAYLALAEHVSPWLAALMVAGVMLLPLLAGVAALTWSVHQRRVQQHHRLDALKAAIAGSAQADPYGFVGAAFMSGLMFSSSAATKQRIAECMSVCRGVMFGG
jgi:hypothetical protein